MALDFGKLNFSVSFNPTSAFPLDARCYFESYELAVEAASTAMPAGDSTTVYHYGMTVCVVENGKANLYIIQPDKTLSEVGSSIAIDEKVFKYNEEEKLSLLGFADAVAGAVVQEPAVLFKVGDGTTAFNDLQFGSAIAADVYSWTKAATKPTYNASEITGLDDYISGQIEDTDTQYKIVKNDAYNYKLQSKALDGDWTDVPDSVITIPKYDDTEVKGDIAALEALVGETAVATQIANAISAAKQN